MLEAGGAQPLPQSHGMSVIDLINNPPNARKPAEWKDAVFSEYCMNDSSVGSGMSANLGGADVHARPGGVQNRMVRSGDWKLNYYHGFEPQLFNLAEDPHELKRPSARSELQGCAR